jgi:CDP-diacylglycerol--glycerol-3-phosphate 3-phosphatidyltransferase
MNLPNKLIILRLALLPIILILLYTDSASAKLWALILFLLATFTDIIDGKIARKLNQVTELGKFLDPLSDKIIINLILIAFVDLRLLPVWMVMLSLVRDIAINETKQKAKSEGLILGSEFSGKAKGALQNLTIFLGLLFLFLDYPNITNLSLNVIFFSMVITLIVIYYSVFDFFWKNRDYISKE